MTRIRNTDIDVPFNFEPRSYQREIFEAYRQGIKRFITVWHRRAGKDKAWVNFMIWAAFQRVGNYFYVLDTRVHAKNIIWTSLADGKPFLFDHLPPEIIKSKSETDLSVRLVNNSTIQLFGADQIKNIRGLNAVGIVFSEYSIQDSEVWPTFSPQLAVNGGWAAFNFTPRGQNHAYKLLQRARENEGWFTSIKTRDDTRCDAGPNDCNADGEVGGKVVTDRAYAEEATTHSDDFLQQEYYCSFSGNTIGSYYSTGLSAMQQEGRIKELPRLDAPVFTVWDLGLADATAIIWAQWTGEFLHIIDYQEFRGQGLDKSIAAVLSKPYVYSAHYAPHDIGVREFTTGQTRIQSAEKFGIRFRVVPRVPLIDGIDKVRRSMGFWKVDEKRCERLLDALHQYHKEAVDPIDPEAGFKEDKPVHDWSSHGADAARYLALVSADEKTWRVQPRVESYDCNDNPYDNPIDEEDKIW